MNKEKYVSKKELATHLGICKQIITKMEQMGMPVYKPYPNSRKRLYKINEVEEWIKKVEDKP